jgi:hypothetical protein
MRLAWPAWSAPIVGTKPTVSPAARHLRESARMAAESRITSGAPFFAKPVLLVMGLAGPCSSRGSVYAPRRGVSIEPPATERLIRRLSRGDGAVEARLRGEYPLRRCLGWSGVRRLTGFVGGRTARMRGRKEAGMDP